MSRDSLAQPRRSLLRVLLCITLCITLAAACDSAAPPTPLSPSPAPSPSPPPAPAPGPPQYRVSGVVLDAADAAPIASATVVLQLTDGELKTQTGADGTYAFTFDTDTPYRDGFRRVPGNYLGLLSVVDGAYWGDRRRGHSTNVQLVPRGTTEVIQNVRLRQVRTLAAGQSVNLSVEPDSSIAWNQEWDPWDFPLYDTLTEEFVVSAPRDGVLTVEAIPVGGSTVATLPCPYVGCPAWVVQGTISIRIEARWSPFYFSVEIPRASAPQRYEIRTSLQ